jgi:hypothetical protein
MGSVGIKPAVARLGARLVANGEKVLAHCSMGFNRSGSGRGISGEFNETSLRISLSTALIQ